MEIVPQSRDALTTAYIQACRAAEQATADADEALDAAYYRPGATGIAPLEALERMKRASEHRAATYTALQLAYHQPAPIPANVPA